MEKLMFWSDGVAPEKMDEILQLDGLIVTDTDTVLGLLARCTQKSFDALNACKGRQQKPYLILVRDIAVAKRYVATSHHEQLEALGEALWPGEVTLIFPASAQVPSFMQSTDGGIALRAVTHSGLNALLDRYEVLFSTSANKAGMSIPVSFEQLDPDVKKCASLLVAQKGQKKSESLPSTIIDCTVFPPTIVRAGVVSRDEIERLAKIRLAH